MGTIYDPRELPGVSTTGLGIGRGVTPTDNWSTDTLGHGAGRTSGEARTTATNSEVSGRNPLQQGHPFYPRSTTRLSGMNSWMRRRRGHRIEPSDPLPFTLVYRRL
jgi:hypothetical protein